MYTKRIQIENYGPIDHLDITFPFAGDNPQPVLLVGKNGSGKSILLSHIVNGLMSAQSVIYPENSEMEQNRVYKLRSPFYIRLGDEYSYAKVDFEQNLYLQELCLIRSKKDFSQKPSFCADSIDQLWSGISDAGADWIDGSISTQNDALKKIFESSCILYFPPDRFEEPAWLNKENLRSKAEYTDMRHMQGYTDRRIIQYSPLSHNRNWLFDLIYDYSVFEMHTRPVSVSVANPKHSNNQPAHSVNLPLLLGYQGPANSLYAIVLSIIQVIFQADENLRLGIGNRQNRQVSLMHNNQTLVPNIFQLSSGETSLLNLFLSILRDFDLSKASFTNADNVRGIVVVDEIDLHLHAVHQYKVLPKLIQMFPRVQFIVTTHSPLFVLGMEKALGTDGFALYELPQGRQISPEEFGEFGNAYDSLTRTKTFLDAIQQAIREAQNPIVFMEGKTDIKYLERAAELLNEKEFLERVQLKDGGGHGNLSNIWKYRRSSKLSEIIEHKKVMLLYDCDEPKEEAEGNVIRLNIPEQKDHPLKKGIENLFEKATLQKAIESKPAFIDITPEHPKIERGEEKIIPEEWNINEHEKDNLCNWLCENGTPDDFKHFQVIFDLLKEIIPAEAEAQASSNAKL